jgi:hypothetical protein
MQRIEIFTSIFKIQKVLEETQLYKYFAVEGQQQFGSELVAADYQKITLLFSKLSDTDKKLLRYFSLLDLNSPRIWGRIFASSVSAGDGTLALEFQNISRSLQYFRQYIPSIVQLFCQEYLTEEQVASALKDYNLAQYDASMFTVLLPEQPNHYSKPERLIAALESISQLYQVAAFVGNQNANTLEVVALDSGTDKAIFYRGDPRVIAVMKHSMKELWNIAVFVNERNLKEGTEWLLKSLRLYNQVLTHELKQTSGPEQMHLLKSNILASAKKLLQTGAITPEIEKLPTYSREIALAHEHKLLMRPMGALPTELTTEPVDEQSAVGATTQGQNGQHAADTIPLVKFVEQELQKTMRKKKAMRQLSGYAPSESGNVS